MIKQVSVFLENRTGRLNSIVSLLGKNNINIRALSLADTSDFGILRLIVDNPDKTISVLKENQYTVGATDVIAIEVEDKPGGLARILSIFSENNINIEYMYAFLGRSGNNAIIIFRFDNYEEVLRKLQSIDVKPIPAEELYNL